MTGFRTQTKTTDLPGKWGRAQIVTTQDRTVSRFPSIRVIAPPGCRGTFEPDNIPNDRNSENERNATRVHSQFVGHFEPKQPVFTKRDRQETGQQKSRVARFSAMPSTRQISSVPHRVDQRAQNLVRKCARCDVDVLTVS